MTLEQVHIENFKSIRELTIDIEEIATKNVLFS